MADETILATFLRKLEVRDVVSAEEKQALIACAADEVLFPAGADLVREGDRPDTSMLVLDGFTSRYRDAPDGTRQITAIHIPGDFVDLHSLLLKEMDHSVGALSACHVVRFPHARLTRLTETHPHLTRLLWLMTLIDASIHREWLAAAARTAPEQIAHLICELYVRLGVTGLIAPDQSFALPLTQTELGEALGLSAVHVNRSLQQLRSEDLFIWQTDHPHPRLGRPPASRLVRSTLPPSRPGAALECRATISMFMTRRVCIATTLGSSFATWIAPSSKPAAPSPT